MSKSVSHRGWRPFAFVASIVTVLALVFLQFPTTSHGAVRLADARHGEEVIGGSVQGKEASGQTLTAAQEQYDNRAYPNGYVDFQQTAGARSAYDALPYSGNAQSWLESGPFTPNVAHVNLTNQTSISNSTTNSGRVTSLAVGPSCGTTSCRLWAGSAGGGVWRTSGALGTHPNWLSSSTGLTSNAIGSIIVDPTDASGNTLYVGTGEPNGSGDSEAGVGLFKSTDGGVSWSLVSGSVPVSKDRSIASIAVDPTNSQHIFIGTALARHGSGSVNGGRFTPPNAPTIGIYESTNGGASFSLAFNLPADVVNPGTTTGSDYFRGGVSKIQLDRTGLTAGQPTRVYASFFDYGLYRRSSVDEAGSTSFFQVFKSAAGSTTSSRTEFSLAPNGTSLRIYVGDAGSGPANFYRVDNADVGHLTLDNGTTNVGWTRLSSSTNGTPGFASYNYCGGQCSYDMPVASPPGQPNTVWIGGQTQYDERYARSNGRAIQRSTDAGVNFTDMTGDATNPYGVLMHPDEHAIVFDPQNPNIAFIGSDGGVVRNDGAFVNSSSSCSGRGLSGADLTDCTNWLSSIPNSIFSFNDGLRTLQFQSVSVNQKNPLYDVMGGTQDNGTWSLNGSPVGTEVIGGDGGQSVIDAGNPNIRMHTFYGPSPDVNFNGTNPTTWDWTGDPLENSGEGASFYIPLIGDPKTSGTMFAGEEHVWRTTDSGGNQSYLDSTCNEYFGSFSGTCGDWTPIGQNLVNSTFGSDKYGSYVVAISRASTDTNTMWVGTRRGRVFISKNANAADASVSFTRVDTSIQPRRFVSGIVVDPTNPNHAWVSFEGYNAYTPTTPGHVFEVTYNPTTGTASWTNVDHNLGDLPITGIQRDDQTGTLYASTDFGVIELANGGTQWAVAANGMPPVAVYGLTVSSSGRVLYAATHGRGVWRLRL